MTKHAALLFLLFLLIAAHSPTATALHGPDAAAAITTAQPTIYNEAAVIYAAPGDGQFINISPDESLIFQSGNQIDYGVLLDAESGQVKRVYTGGYNQAKINESNDTIWLAGTNQLRDIESGAILNDFSSHGTVFGTANDLGNLFIRKSNTLIHRIDAVTGEVLQSYNGTGLFNHASMTVRVSPDQSKVAFGIGFFLSSNRHTFIFDYESGAHLRTINSFGAAAATNWAPDNQHIIIGSRVANRDEHRVQIYDALSGALIWEHNRRGSSVSFSGDGAIYMVGGDSGDVALFDFATGTLIWQRTLGGGGTNAQFIKNDSEILASHSNGGHIRVLSAADGSLIKYLRYTHRNALSGSQLSPDGSRLTTFSEQDNRGYYAHLIEWQTDESQVDKLLGVGGSNGLDGRTYDVAYSPDGAQLLAGQSYGGQFVYLYDLEQETFTNPISTMYHNARVDVVAFSPDGRLAATGSESSNKLYLWDTRDWTPLYELDGNSGQFRDLEFSPDGTLLALGHSHISHGTVPSVLVWDTATGLLKYSFSSGWARKVSFSPNSQTLAGASGEDGGDVRLWDMATGNEIRNFAGIFPGEVYSVEYSPDGAKLLVAGSNSVARIWDLAADRIVGEIHTPQTNIIDAYWHPDGESVFTETRNGGEDSVVRWRLDAGIRLERNEPITLIPTVTRTGSAQTAGWSDYVITTSPEQSLLISVTTSISNSIHIYSQYGQQPTLGLHQQQVDGATAVGSYAMLFPNTQAGQLFIGIYGLAPTDFEIVAQYVDRYLADVSPTTIGNNGSVSLLVDGVGLADAGISAALCKNGTNQYTASELTLLQSGQLAAAFDLDEATVGVYDFCLTWENAARGDQSPETQMLTDAITIVPSSEVTLDTEVIVPNVHRPNRTYGGQIRYENAGTNSMPAPLFVLTASGDAQIKTACERELHSGPIQLLGVPFTGLASTLSPGQEGRASFNFRGTGADVEFSLDRIEPSADLIDWDGFKATMKPDDMSDTDWDAVFPTLTAQLGDSWQQYIETLGDNAQRVRNRGGTPYCVRDLLTLELREAQALPTAAIAGHLKNAATKETLAGADIVAYGENGIESATTNLVDGRFTLEYLPDGRYEIFAEDFYFDPPAVFTVTNQSDITGLELFALPVPVDAEQAELPPVVNDMNPVVVGDNAGIFNLMWQRDEGIWFAQYNPTSQEWINLEQLAANGSDPTLIFDNELMGGAPGLAAIWQEGYGNAGKLFYALAPQQPDGSYDWQLPTQLTFDNYGDTAPQIVRLGNGQLLATWLQRDFESEDDFDIYYANISPTSRPDLLTLTERETLLNAATTSSVENAVHCIDVALSKGSTVPGIIPVIGGKYGFEISGQTCAEIACTLTHNAALSAKVLFADDSISGSTNITAKYNTNVNECKYVFDQASVGLNLSGSRSVSTKPRRFLGLEGELGATLTVGTGGTVQWTGANFPGLPNSGSINVNVTVEPSGKIKVFGAEGVVSGSGGVTAKYEPPTTVDLDYCLKLTGSVSAWVVKYSYTGRWGCFTGGRPTSNSQLTNTEFFTEVLTTTTGVETGTTNAYEGQILPVPGTAFSTTNDFQDGAAVMVTVDNLTTVVYPTNPVLTETLISNSLMAQTTFDGISYTLPISISTPNTFSIDPVVMSTGVLTAPVVVVYKGTGSTAGFSPTSSADSFENLFNNASLYISVMGNDRSWTPPIQLPNSSGGSSPQTATDEDGDLLIVWNNDGNTIDGTTCQLEPVSCQPSTTIFNPPGTIKDVTLNGSSANNDLTLLYESYFCSGDNGTCSSTLYQATRNNGNWTDDGKLVLPDSSNLFKQEGTENERNAGISIKPPQSCCTTTDGAKPDSPNGGTQKNEGTGKSDSANSLDPNEKVGACGV